MNDSNTPLQLLQPEYDTPYGKPEVEAIKTVLDQVYNYLNQTTPMELIDNNSGEVITDFSKINETSYSGLCNYQSGQGFWYQLIDTYDSIGKNT